MICGQDLAHEIISKLTLMIFQSTSLLPLFVKLDLWVVFNILEELAFVWTLHHPIDAMRLERD